MYMAGKLMIKSLDSGTVAALWTIEGCKIHLKVRSFTMMVKWKISLSMLLKLCGYVEPGSRHDTVIFFLRIDIKLNNKASPNQISRGWWTQKAKYKRHKIYATFCVRITIRITKHCNNLPNISYTFMNIFEDGSLPNIRPCSLRGVKY